MDRLPLRDAGIAAGDPSPTREGEAHDSAMQGLLEQTKRATGRPVAI